MEMRVCHSKICFGIWESSETNLQRFETRFGVKSLDFYDAMLRGELEEFDALDDYRTDFVEWLALYKTWTSFDERLGRRMEFGAKGRPAAMWACADPVERAGVASLYRDARRHAP